ncbi:MAG: hypothetical protein V8Q42_07455 [Anaerovoracaceae bacterium]
MNNVPEAANSGTFGDDHTAVEPARLTEELQKKLWNSSEEEIFTVCI